MSRKVTLVYLTDSTAIQKRLLWQPKTFQSKANETHTHTHAQLDYTGN